jgi:hypothetical protein
MTDIEKAVSDKVTAVKMLLQLEEAGWDNVVEHGDTWNIVTLTKDDRKISASGYKFLEVVQRLQQKVTE